MSTFKKVLTKILLPHIAVVIILALISAVMLVYVFAFGKTNSVIAYAAYPISAYALTIVCIRMKYVFIRLKNFKNNNKFISRIANDVKLRLKISLYCSISMNILYVLLQIYLGILNRTVWFYSLAVYYVLLTLMRLFLLKDIKKEQGVHYLNELFLYRFCGIMLVFMNVVLTGIVFYIVWQGRGFVYHYIVTIAMAAYTFFTLTLSIVNMVKYRKYKSPTMSASKAINFATALVSMLALETAMIASFGQGNDTFRGIMTAATGSVVCVTVLITAIYMIIRSTVQINQYIKENINESREENV